MARDFKIFISHSWAHDDDLESLRRLLNDRGYFNVDFLETSKRTPIKSDNTSYIKSVLKRNIQNSDIVLALAGVYASYSEWMVWELQTAVDSGIPIVGIIPRGQEKISTEVYTRSKCDVRWNTESIVNAIRSYAN